MKKVIIILLSLLVTTIVLGAKEDYFTSVGELKKLMNSDKKVLILDARGSKEAYLGGHVPGAILVNWTEFSQMDGTPADKNWGILDGKEKLEEKLREKGISDNKKIVVYTDTLKGWGADGRIFWMLRYAGLTDVKILDGGIREWKKTEKIAHFPTLPKKSDYKITKLNKDLLINTTKLSQNLEKYNLVDTREPAEYDGNKNYGEAKYGRIPTSKSVFFKTLLDKNGKVKSKEKVAEILKKAKFDLSKPFVTYCTGGIRSAEAWTVLYTYGYNVINYDASFSGWASTEGLKIENQKFKK